MKIEKRRKKRLRNMICATWCIVELAMVLLGFKGLEALIVRTEETIGTDSIQGEIVMTDEPEEERGLVVCLDAGHGGKDNGSDYRGRYEKDDSLKLAQAVAAYLREKDVTVVLTRETDVFLSLEERCAYANEQKADYFVSLHRNDGEGYGVETWVYSGASDETLMLAEGIMERLDAAGIQRSRGVKKGTQKSESGNYYVNIHSDMPSCIVEMGFIGNAQDNQLFDEKLTDYAAAIGEAVMEAYAARQAADSAAGADGQAQGADGGDQSADGQTQQSAQTIDLQGLDATSVNWGLGKHTDGKNRPNDAVAAQEKYGAYNAVFIGADSQTIYLTFDEGYEYGYTEAILDTLKAKDVKAVFFVTEPYAKAEPALVRRMIDEGHVVGNHSVTHPSAGMPSLSVEKQQNEVMENHQYVQENFGYEMKLFRYPAGKYSEQSLAVVNNCGYKSVFWSFAYMDYDVDNQPDAKESLQKMTDRLHPGAVYLLHAESKTNAQVLGSFIEAAREQGYSFASEI